MTEIERAIPTIKAPYMRFWQPARKVDAISFAFMPPIIPAVIAMKIKVAVISASVQCRRKAPIKNAINDKAETSYINLWRIVQGTSVFSISLSLERALLGNQLSPRMLPLFDFFKRFTYQLIYKMVAIKKEI